MILRNWGGGGILQRSFRQINIINFVIVASNHYQGAIYHKRFKMISSKNDRRSRMFFCVVHTILTEMMADNLIFLRPEIKNYKAEADADLIPIPGQLELHGRCRCGVLLSTCFCALFIAHLLVGMEELELHCRHRGRNNFQKTIIATISVRMVRARWYLASGRCWTTIGTPTTQVAWTSMAMMILREPSSTLASLVVAACRCMIHQMLMQTVMLSCFQVTY